MISDLNDISEHLELQSDVVIVGSGPAGIALAHRLSSSKLSVVVLEGGGLRREDASQFLNEADTIGLQHTSRVAGRSRGFGGAGRLWAGQCLPMDEIDFQNRPWIPLSGWPFNQATLHPYYRRAEDFFHISGERYDRKIYELFRIKDPGWADSKLISMFTVYTPDLDTGDTWEGLFAQAANVHLIVHANITNIELNPAEDSFSFIEARSLKGTNCRVTAKAAILCTGGLENARLLLMSRRQRPNGLGNENDLVGRFFQEHPNAMTADVVTNNPEALQEKFRILYGRNGRRYFPKFRLSPEIQEAQQVANCNASLVFEYSDDSGIAALQETVRAIRERRMPSKMARKLFLMLWKSPEVVRSIFLRVRSGRSPSGTPIRIRLQCYLEQVPQRESRVSLSSTADELGLPRLAVDWHVALSEIKTLRVATQTVRDEFARLNLGEVIPAPWLSLESGWESFLADCAHHCGTTRMSDSPQTGVVDANCQVFGINGLFVCGSSVFPTSGYANPTLTIVALSIRLGDYLSKVLG